MGEIKGFSLKPGAVERYYQTSEYRSSYMRQLRDMIGRNSYQQFSHPNLQLPRIRKDETDVHAFVELMQNNWINPMSHDETDLVHLSTGVLAPPNAVRDLLKTHQIGDEAYKIFRERLEKDPPDVNCHEQMK